MTRRSAVSILLATAMVSMLAACDFKLPAPAMDLNLSVTRTLEAVATQVEATLRSVPSATPSETPTPPEADSATPTPTPVPSPIPESPAALLGENTNCRTGPGTVFDQDYTALKGALLEIVGRTTVPKYVIVNVPGESGHTCWLWTRYAEVRGDLTLLPISTPPPTPTPSVQFKLNYSYLEGCVGWDPGMKVVNTGSVTFRSARITAEDTVTSTTVQQSVDEFHKRSGCAIDQSIPQLDPGMTGYVYANTFVYDPTGHELEVTVKLCTGPGLSGTCVSRSIIATP